MCFLISPKWPKLQVADKDIVCWKRLRRTSKGFCNPCEYVPHTLYLPNVVLPKKILRVRYTEPSIDIGYHSFKTRKLCIRSWLNSSSIPYKCSTHKYSTHKYSTHKCIIPKGATYYENDCQYVSSQIMLVK